VQPELQPLELLGLLLEQLVLRLQPALLARQPLEQP
jgi:hypothetical protein